MRLTLKMRTKEYTASYPDHSISLVLGLSDASIFLNLGCASFPQRMQVILRAREMERNSRWLELKIHFLS